MVDGCDVCRRRQQELEELHEELEYQLRPLLEKSGNFSYLLLYSAALHLCRLCLLLSVVVVLSVYTTCYKYWLWSRTLSEGIAFVYTIE